MRALLLVLTLALPAGVSADDAHPNRIERGAQKVEKGVTNTANRTGNAIERGAKKVEKGVTNTGNAMERGANRTDKKIKKILE